MDKQNDTSARRVNGGGNEPENLLLRTKAQTAHEIIDEIDKNLTRRRHPENYYCITQDGWRLLKSDILGKYLIVQTPRNLEKELKSG